MNDLLAIYVLNLILTVAMFIVLIFRAWIEYKNFRIMWRELEWRRARETAREILRAEKDIFEEVEGGKDLYRLLCDMFQISEDEVGPID